MTIPVFERPYGLDTLLADAIPIGLFDSAGLAVVNPTLQSAVRASVVGTFTGSPQDTGTITVPTVNLGNRVYTFKTTLSTGPTVAYEVLIGADQDTALTNLGAAINGTGTEGTDYGTGTVPHPDFEAVVDTGANTITFNAKHYGDAYNTAGAAIAEACDNYTDAALTSGVDTPDFKQAPDYGTQANASNAPIARNGIFPFCPNAAQNSFKQVHYEFDDDSATDFVRQDFVVRTTDHPAAGDPKGCQYWAKLVAPSTDISTTWVDLPTAAHGSGTAYSSPTADNISVGMWCVVTDLDNGVSDGAEIGAFDFDGGNAANLSRATFVTGLTLVLDFTSSTNVLVQIYLDKGGAMRVLNAASGVNIDANVQLVNDVAIVGDGSTTPFQV